MKKEEVTIDELLEKIPNKYELAIIAGKLAREEFLNNRPKREIMDEVFKRILNGDFSDEIDE